VRRRRRRGSEGKSPYEVWQLILQQRERRVAILGTGSATPERTVTSEELDRQLGHALGTVFAQSGVSQRQVAAKGETAAALGARAARSALDAAGLTMADIDCVVSASATMDQGMPCNAALIYREIGASDRAVPAFDVNASCLGFLVAMETLSWPIAAGRYERVLVVAADIASCALNWDDLGASAIFGDGAAAAVLGPGDASRILHSEIRTYPQGAHLCEIPAGGSRYHPSRMDEPLEPYITFRMNGKGVFKLASAHLPQFLNDVLAGAGVTLDDIDWVVPHQASRLALDHVCARLGFRDGCVIDVFSELGNQVAASLPTALDRAVRDGRVRRGDTLLLLGTGAGLTLGAMVLQY
jgi:3-oxoacyl-[acyl-carrier-protein] synthase III